MKKLFGCVLAALSLLACSKAPEWSEKAVFQSPDGRLELRFSLSRDGVPAYALNFDGKPVVERSRLGYTLIDGADLQKGFSLEGIEENALDETWEPVWGEEARIRNHYNERLLHLKKADGTAMDLRFRLYDDGLGFRYEFPMENRLTYFQVQDELTEFALTGDHTAWWISGDYDTQEYNYTESKLSEIASISGSMRPYNASQAGISPSSVQTALQLKTADGLYLNIHEAAVLDYPTTNLELDPAGFVWTAWSSIRPSPPMPRA